MEPKHEITIRTANGPVTVRTTDIQDLLTQPIIAELLGTKQEVVAKSSSAELQLALAEIKNLRGAVMQLKEDKQKLQEAMMQEPLDEQPMQQSMQQARPPMQPMMQKAPMQAPQAPQAPQGARARLPPSTFLEITPDQMQPNIWEGLSPDQQQEWMRKYNIA